LPLAQAKVCLILVEIAIESSESFMLGKQEELLFVMKVIAFSAE
jgi:hypothetical protein